MAHPDLRRKRHNPYTYRGHAMTQPSNFKKGIHESKQYISPLPSVRGTGTHARDAGTSRTARRCVRAAFWSTLSRGAIPLKRNAHEYFSLKRKAEMELNARQRQIASEALCRFVIERVKAEPVWGDEALKRFRRALIPQLRLLNQDFESDCSESADGQAAEETSSENADIPNRMKTEAAELSTNPSWFARVSSDRRKISIFLLTTPTTAKELVFQLPLTIDCLVEQEHLPKPLLEFLTWCAKT